MKVILTQEVKSIGKRDELVNVSEGYFRNFLQPRRLAVAAEGTALAEWQRRRKTEEAKSAKLSADAKALAAQIAELKVTIKGKVGSGSRLYGSITSADIAEALEKQHKVKIDKRKIELEDPIKALGSVDVPIRLHKDATAHLKVEVVGE
ncbi:MAG TPA: 50S ribosomal protein L9 [Armatimonadota bacterium]|jgi:large subunit ribosomal protein L9